MSSPRLSTTAVAVLGLLGIRSMTGYEITQSAQRTYRWLWPREDSVLYEQPRRLQDKGLVTSAQEDGLRRQRTRYTITAEGREAVAAWLATPADAHFDWEPAVRLILADQGRHDDLLATLRAIRDWALEGIRDGIPVAEAILDGTSPFPDRASLSGMNAVFVSDLLLTVHHWAEAALEEMQHWSSPTDDAGRDGWRELLRQRVERGRALLAERADPGDDERR
ncbi:PadR family transcriptional regulator [Nocardioides humilatus]|nr:helix-turn-helix transcriptional regulator [Nocardioides humilatus]